VKQAAGLNLSGLILARQGAWKLKTKPADMFMMPVGMNGTFHQLFKTGDTLLLKNQEKTFMIHIGLLCFKTLFAGKPCSALCQNRWKFVLIYR
jgi:hypothetical protein